MQRSIDNLWNTATSSCLLPLEILKYQKKKRHFKSLWIEFSWNGGDRLQGPRAALFVEWLACFAGVQYDDDGLNWSYVQPYLCSHFFHCQAWS